MTNKQIFQQIASFSRVREGWIEILLRDRHSVTAAQHILSINTKIEFLQTLIDYSVDIPEGIL